MEFGQGSMTFPGREEAQAHGVGETVACVGSLSRSVITGIEEVAEDEAGEPGHSQIPECIRFMQWGRLKVLPQKSGPPAGSDQRGGCKGRGLETWR